MAEAVTCPRCGMTSHNPDDVREGYCGRCNAWTSGPYSEHPSSFDMAPADLLAGAHRFTQGMQAYRDAELEKMRAKAEVEYEVEQRAADLEKRLGSCPGCGGPITALYWKYGVCADCYNTTDDPRYPR